MFEALTKSFPMAMGIAFSPTSLLAIIILLMSQNGKLKSISFFFGTIIGIQIIGTLVIFIPGLIADHGGMSDHTGTGKIILGMLLLVSVYPILQKKKKQGTTERIPKVFKSLDGFSLIKIFIIGFVFSAFSIKNMALSASGAIHIRTTSTVIYYIETLLGVFLFSLLASFTIIIPIVISFLVPKKTESILLNLRDWLVRNHWNIVMFMLIISGALLLYIGVGIHMA